MPSSSHDRPQHRSASALREALGRLAAGERLPRLDALSPDLRDAVVRMEALLAVGQDARDPRGAHAPTHAVLVGVDRLAAIRQLGAELAEEITAELAARIRATLPEARLRRTGRGSIEFVFACEPEAAIAGLEQLHAALEARISVGGQVFDLPIAIGFARADAGSTVDDTLAEAAEHALARAQAEHRKVVEFDAAARALRSDQLALMRDLRGALERDELHLCYQPKLDARTGAIASAEALIRWPHPERGMVPPDQFIGLAEQTGEIGHVTERVLQRVLADQARMREAGAPMAIDVNVSGGLFCDSRFADWALARIAGATDPIGFEITETAVIKDPEQAIAGMRTLAAAGVAIAIDDYGSGLSSLAYLKQLPAHELKIDKTFISGLTSSHRDPLIVRSTIDLAHALEMRVTAEGVDNPASRALLTVMGCDMLQGYDISPPLTPEVLVDFVRDYDPQAVKRAPGLFASRRWAER